MSDVSDEFASLRSSDASRSRSPEPPVKRPRGRPKGSGKPKPMGPKRRVGRPSKPSTLGLKRGRGRPRKERNASAVALSELIDTNANAASVSRLAEQWAEDVAESRAYLESPNISDDDLEFLLQPVDLSSWSQAVQDEWEASDERAAFQYLDANPSMYLLTTWKISLRIFHCSPLAIISPRLDLYFKQEATYIHGESPADLWSQSFCESLSKIMSHYFWRNSPTLISFFVRFATVYRTGDRRSLLPLYPGTCSMMRKLEVETAHDDWSADYHTLHIRLRNSFRSKGMQTSIESDILYTLGQVIVAQKYLSVKIGPEDAFPVTTGDLQNIIKALDTCTSDTWRRMGYRTEMSYLQYRDAAPPDSPPSLGQLIVMHTNGWLKELSLKHSGYTAAYNNHAPKRDESPPARPIQRPSATEPSSWSHPGDDDAP